ncbi:pimeloyl-ACP methyl ester carboxylesterase [Ciceribacter lividus]|uniref:Pimeloyl-ACP methyl ester carboxylesterase n=1 Tax=Ciceribacter lividus TaxID=1197950 RepID=A0A6I7HQ68_9HYPH|nr:alpha/beta hydrolase [Ciceribacter lividus]RCW27891.1 pimeloyl-ACP methyl ester carboxylesterase [Ciceribacter lividus]
MISQSRRSVLATAAATAAVLSMPLAGQAAERSLSAPTKFLEAKGRRLAYRTVGTGRPLVLCNRFRGVLDLWDPAFIDGLADQGFQVITFDYSGLGKSTGEKSYNPMSLAQDTVDLIAGLGLEDFAIGGWSIGGITAQIVLAMTGDKASHVVLLATTPPGHLVKSGEQLFYDTAAKPGTNLDQFTTVFFEPSDAVSREASKRSFERIMARKEDRSPDVPADWAIAQIGNTPRNPLFPAEQILDLLKVTKTPILHLGGDHDIVMPVENWYALNNQLPTLHLITYPRVGHGPHHQYPELAAAQIGAFVKNTRKS